MLHICSQDAAQRYDLWSGHTLAVVVPLRSVPLMVHSIEVALPGLGVIKKSFVAVFASVFFAGHDWRRPKYALE